MSEMSEFFRFPHTPHLAWLGDGAPRADKVLSTQEASLLLQNEVVVEEKLDGANIGISLRETGGFQVQNRGNYLSLPYRGQFSRLSSWLGERCESLTAVLTFDIVLFGEWCAACHSLSYDRLPDWFMLFDVYSRSDKKFWSTKRRNELAEVAGFFTVPKIAQGRYTIVELTDLLLVQPSRYRTGALEGVVVRTETDTYGLGRAKLVRPDFTQAIEQHWSSHPIQWNHVSNKQ